MSDNTVATFSFYIQAMAAPCDCDLTCLHSVDALCLFQINKSVTRWHQLVTEATKMWSEAEPTTIHIWQKRKSFRSTLKLCLRHEVDTQNTTRSWGVGCSAGGCVLLADAENTLMVKKTDYLNRLNPGSWSHAGEDAWVCVLKLSHLCTAETSESVCRGERRRGWGGKWLPRDLWATVEAWCSRVLLAPLHLGWANRAGCLPEMAATPAMTDREMDGIQVQSSQSQAKDRTGWSCSCALIGRPVHPSARSAPLPTWTLVSALTSDPADAPVQPIDIWWL